MDSTSEHGLRERLPADEPGPRECGLACLVVGVLLGIAADRLISVVSSFKNLLQPVIVSALRRLILDVFRDLVQKTLPLPKPPSQRFDEPLMPVYTENLSSGVVVMKSAQDGT